MKASDVMESFPFDDDAKFFLWPLNFGVWSWVGFGVLTLFGVFFVLYNLVVATADDDEKIDENIRVKFLIGTVIAIFLSYIIVAFAIMLTPQYDHKLTKQWSEDSLRPYIKELPEKHLKVIGYKKEKSQYIESEFGKFYELIGQKREGENKYTVDFLNKEDIVVRKDLVVQIKLDQTIQEPYLSYVEVDPNIPLVPNEGDFLLAILHIPGGNQIESWDNN